MVFISYRREDSAGHAGRLFDRFVKRLGRDRVFRDVDNIRPGDNFREVIHEKLAASEVLLVLIGPDWLTAVDRDGRKRLEDPNDLVRLEIESGIERKMRIIPVLLPGATMPDPKELPNSLASLAHRNAFEVREPHFDRDIRQLISDAKGGGQARGKPKVGRGLMRITPEAALSKILLMGLTYDAGAFVHSARRGDAAAVSLFLGAGMKPDQAPGDRTAFQFALDEGHIAIAKVLIEAGANVDRAVPSVARNGNLELFKLLLSKKPSHKVLVWCLSLAAGGGHFDLVKQLLDDDIDINSESQLPLVAAAYSGGIEMVKYLLARGAAVNAVDCNSGGSGETALHSASRGCNSYEIVSLLLDAGAEVDVQDRDGATPLMNAVNSNSDRRDVALLLLANAADTNARTKDGTTALMYAAGSHRPKMIQDLVDKRADVNAQNNHGWTPLMYTSGAIDWIDDPSCVQLLIDNGADLNLRSGEGWTALMFAANQGLTGAAQVLIDQGANWNITNDKGETALSLAMQNGREKMIQILRSGIKE